MNERRTRKNHDWMRLEGWRFKQKNVINYLLKAECQCFSCKCQDVAIQPDHRILFKSVWELNSAELMTYNTVPQGGSNVYINRLKTNEEDKFRVQWSSQQNGVKMLLVLSEDHKEHLALLTKVAPSGKSPRSTVLQYRWIMLCLLCCGACFF